MKIEPDLQDISPDYRNLGKSFSEGLLSALEFPGDFSQPQVHCPQPKSCHPRGGEKAGVNIPNPFSHQPMMFHQPKSFYMIGSGTSGKRS